MNKYGLSDEILDEIVAVFQKNSAVSRVILFGSRAMNTHRPGSDIDLAVDGDELGMRDIVTLHDALEDLDLLYTFDLLNQQKLTESALIDHIDRVGISIYDRQSVHIS
jgi:predicted nucleotidyltransferase